MLLAQYFSSVNVQQKLCSRMVTKELPPDPGTCSFGCHSERSEEPMHSDAGSSRGAGMARSMQQTHDGRGAILGHTKGVVRISYGNAAILPKSLYDKKVRMVVFFPAFLSDGSHLRRKPKHPGDYSR